MSESGSEVGAAAEAAVEAERVAEVELAPAAEPTAELTAEVSEPEEKSASGVETAPEVLPLEPDPVLLDSRELARAALTEITDAQTIGADEGHEAHEQHVLTLYFECRLAGYPGWRWAATLSRVDEHSPVNVLEVELLPGEGSVTAPEWVPWSERLAQYRETQSRQASEEAAAAEAAAAELADEDDVDPEDDLLENDHSDFEDEIDGVDIDEDLDDDDESDEDGFSDIDEHDLHDHSDEEVDFESQDEEE